ncbi:MAG: T9SS type A sorting domain-containing protein [Clostridia bacterium]|nr:T9SS type A sorting domain-containing protein [Clostridia bacterium]
MPSTNFTTLKIYDVLGREIATLVNEVKDRGEYEVELDVEKLKLSSGIYFYKLRCGNREESKKFILME